ncbi:MULTISPECIES: hypothetical protein [unclassified Rhodococcus (in: high G+C Gram-positive bacteria)]|uniref:hypothetical protein n=1 Tax=unclassified Rhodococcus (in: high G+C Gram-positive bacteria) TaxID=192944 RepID=UPI00163A2F14|nr:MULTISPECIES: hypothetical protein [unclassified Rhodococcus (in: high G+C Gram-positive bacteria)]MBC2639657.1 hypothetical protein [Rhodococcus sp. 3A]MBC2895597.1 hypothetical protein [Rhodococcus sp. 4CII]
MIGEHWNLSVLARIEAVQFREVLEFTESEACGVDNSVSGDSEPVRGNVDAQLVVDETYQPRAIASRSTPSAAA